LDPPAQAVLASRPPIRQAIRRDLLIVMLVSSGKLPAHENPTTTARRASFAWRSVSRRIRCAGSKCPPALPLPMVDAGQDMRAKKDRALHPVEGSDFMLRRA
jgi:hypothetical protein